ncbi:MAG: RMD1 family protein [Clostridiaceae bacterium]|jgi:uncharacterized Rmd1/YagE family protein|nr:RMD1 family protein [Clostridiaceae bacterium]
MGKKHFICYKAYDSIDLRNTASLFGLPAPESRDRFIVLRGKQLAEIFKYDMKRKRILLFSMGCIVFEDFNIDETDIFFETLGKTIGEPDYRMLAVFRELHTITITDQQTMFLWPDSTEAYPVNDDLLDIIAAILAKATALSKEESDIGKLLDEADSHISRFQEGILSSGTRRYTSTMAHIIKFEQQSTAGIRIFDRPATAAGSLQLREAYDKLSAYFELEDRYGILESKAAQLRKIVRTYSTLKYRRQENRLLVFEIFLLALFPLFRIIEYIIGNHAVKSFVRMIFPHLLQKFNIYY